MFIMGTNERMTMLLAYCLSITEKKNTWECRFSVKQIARVVSTLYLDSKVSVP